MTDYYVVMDFVLIASLVQPNGHFAAAGCAFGAQISLSNHRVCHASARSIPV